MVVVPADTPVTEPGIETVATEVLDDIQEPPAEASDSVMDEPTQTEAEPDMAPTVGVGLMVTVYVAVADPHELLTV